MAGWRVKLPEPGDPATSPSTAQLGATFLGMTEATPKHQITGIPAREEIPGQAPRTVWPLFDVAANDPRIKYPMQNGMPTLPPERARVAYLLPFEIVSIHLTVVLIGAAYLARAKRRREVSA
jgi:NADH-quinone oxidoreductase subunit J